MKIRLSTGEIKDISFSPHQEIYKFKLEKKLGNGSFGEVWLAEDTTINKKVALKILPSDFSQIASTLDEARNGNKVNHRNLLQIFYADVVKLDANANLVLIAQDYQENGSVTNYLNSRNFLPLPLLLRVLKDVSAGLEYLHNGNIIHNDIKPGNILMDSNMNAVLSDYGISSVFENGETTLPKQVYLLHGAPEVLNDNSGISIQSDIYELGCTAYRLANGIDELSFKDIKTEDELINAKLSRKLPPSAHQFYVPKKLTRIINKATEVEYSKRYSSALEFRRDLEKLCFPGYWTTDEVNTSKLIGIGKNYIYEYSAKPKSGNLFDFETYRTNKKTNRKTKITTYCKKNITSKEKNKIESAYFQWVIENAQ